MPSAISSYNAMTIKSAIIVVQRNVTSKAKAVVAQKDQLLLDVEKPLKNQECTAMCQRSSHQDALGTRALGSGGALLLTLLWPIYTFMKCEISWRTFKYPLNNRLAKGRWIKIKFNLPRVSKAQKVFTFQMWLSFKIKRMEIAFADNEQNRIKIIQKVSSLNVKIWRKRFIQHLAWLNSSYKFFLLFQV